MAPIDILQGFLDRMSRAVMTGDWAAYRGGVDLPFLLITAAASFDIDEEKKLRAGFDDFVETLRAQRIDEYVRLATSAEFVTDNLLAGRYETEMLSRGARVVPRFPSRIVLRHLEGTWRAAAIVNPLQNAQWPLRVPHPLPESERTER